MKKSKVYTKGGDTGETSLVSGKRLAKSNTQIDLYGDVDTLNSHIGYLISLIESEAHHNPEIINVFQVIQNAMFDLGSLLACEPENWERYKLKKLEPQLILNIENLIDKLDSELEPLKNFILPGGATSAAYTHIVRTYCRMVERKLVAYLNIPATIPENSLQLLNRLSDLFFIVSRYQNYKNNKKEILWNISS